MVKKIRSGVLVAIAFLLGAGAMLYVDWFNVIVIGGLLFNVIAARKDFLTNFKRPNVFIKLPLFFGGYLLFHTIALKLWGQEDVRYSYSVFESLGLYFVLLPLYLFSNRDLLEDSRLLKKLLLFFTIGVGILNVAIFFNLVGDSFFHQPLKAISDLAAGRFGGNKEVFGGFIFLEPQALYINIAAMFAFYWSLLTKNIFQRIGFILLFLLLLFFLLLTETKSAYIAFIAGACVMMFFFLRKKSWKARIGYAGMVLVCILIIGAVAPVSVKERMQQAKTELNNVMNNKLAGGGTIMPRVALYKVNFSHFEEFGIWGLGVAYTNTVKKWYKEADYGIGSLTDPHNSFVFFWLVGGLPGLLFVISLFVVPFWHMLKRKNFSYLVLALWLILLIANNTTVLLSLNDSKPLILFFLTLLYLKSEQFRHWEIEYFNRFERERA